MAAGHSTIDDFFAKLADLFESRQRNDHGSIFLVQKRLSHGENGLESIEQADKEGYFADLNPTAPQRVLIRATNGDSRDKIKSKVKLSTVVQPEELGKFYARYGEVCKLGMQGLKKRDRSGRKKATKAKKRKGQDADKKT